MANSQRYTREIPRRYRLEAQKFTERGYVTLAKRYIDPENGSQKFDPITLSGFGKILTFTFINIASDQFSKESPFPVAIIETDEGARLTAQVTDCALEDVKIGARVQLVFRKMMEEGHTGIINYCYKAILV
jgi:uncharacterized OB-fold protein